MKVVATIQFLSFFFFSPVGLSWNTEDNRNLLLKITSKLVLYHVVLSTPNTSPEKRTLTVGEMTHLPDIEETDAKKEFSCLKWTMYNGGRKVCVHFKTDRDNLKVVVYRCGNHLYFNDKEDDPKFTEYESLLEKRKILLKNIGIFFKRCIILVEKSVHKWETS